MLISAFAFRGIPEQAVRKAVKECEIYISPAILQEYRDTPLQLEANNKINHTQFKAVVSGIAAFVLKTKLIVPTKKLFICRDAEDNILLECCLSAKVNILLTGDKDLFNLPPLSFDLKILTPRQFIEKL